MIKKCKICELEKEMECFVKNKNSKNGYENICKTCKNERMKIYKQSNKYKKYKKAYNNTYKDREKENVKKRKNKNPLLYRSRVLYAGMRDRARTKGIAFDKEYFSIDYIFNKLSEKPYCECCNKKLDIDFKPDKKFNDNSPSMDRVNSNLGYIKGNVAILCWKCNKHKQDSSSEELRMIADFMDCWGNEVGGEDE